jgi:hypothetical protein
MQLVLTLSRAQLKVISLAFTEQSRFFFVV